MAISSATSERARTRSNALFGLEYNRYENEHGEIFEEESSDRALKKK